SPSRFMVLDANARRHLEIYQSGRDGSRSAALFEALDTTRTAMGARLLRRWLGQPLLDVEEINARLDAVELFREDGLARQQVREALRGLPDFERITSRISGGTASPRDLAGLRGGLDALPRLLEALPAAAAARTRLATALASLGEAKALLEASIADDPAPNPGEGGVIRDGFSAALDEARSLTGDARRALAELETEERERTGIRSLRVVYNRVFGYYIEGSKANLDAVPEDFQRRQTLVGAERCVTPRLKELEERILEARETIGDLEAS